MAELTTYTITTPVISVNQMYRCVSSRNIISKKGRETKEAIQWELQAQRKGAPRSSKVEMNVLFYFGDKRKRDIDNCLKALLDCCTGILYEDDSQIEALHVYKQIDKKNPRTILQIL